MPPRRPGRCCGSGSTTSGCTGSSGGSTRATTPPPGCWNALGCGSKRTCGRTSTSKASGPTRRSTRCSTPSGTPGPPAPPAGRRTAGPPRTATTATTAKPTTTWARPLRVTAESEAPAMPATGDAPGTGAACGPSAPEWTAEHDVGRDLAARLIGSRFPGLRRATVEPLATGWDNTVFLVDGRWVFRFPRRTAALECLRRETAVLPLIADGLPLPVPLPELIGEPGDDYPWPFWGARLLPGTELADSALPDRDRVRAGARAGEFLRALHDPEVARTAGAGLPVDPLRRADPSVRAPMARERLDRLRGLGLLGALDPRRGAD